MFVCLFVCLCVLYRNPDCRSRPDQTRRGAPSRPRARFGLPGSRKFRPPGYPLYCGGEGILVGRGPLASRWGEGGEGDGSLPTHSTTKPLEGGGGKMKYISLPPPTFQNVLSESAPEPSAERCYLPGPKLSMPIFQRRYLRGPKLSMPIFQRHYL